MASTSTHLAYTGLRVLDLSQGIAGPYCGQILRQFGADVVKAEPLEGDWSRRIGLARGGMTAITMAFNRGKRSLACDARNPEGRALLALLAARTGIVIQSFRPGVAQRMGLGPAEVAVLNVPAPELPAAMAAGQIDAAAAWTPQFHRIRALPGVKLLADDTAFSLFKSHKVTPGPDVLVVRQAFADKNPLAVRGFLKGYFSAIAMLRDRPQEAARQLLALTGLSLADQVEAILGAQWYGSEQQRNLLKVPGTYVDGLQGLADMLVAHKQIDKAPVVGQWIDASHLA
ncbi:hypothetical protein ET532_006565 [Verminephrobacter sp. Larva24]|nr:hypothetical protein ET532_006565 [Verminephrobacter sp. Larva24]